MKRILACMIMATSMFLAHGCYEQIEIQIADLKQDLSALEQKVSNINSNLNSLSDLVKALESNDHISSIREQSSDGVTGYLITFSSGRSIFLYNGTTGVTPIVGVRYNEERDGYFWTIQMGEDGTPTWMTNSYGLRVRATSTVPRLKIEDGVWWYSYDGSSWTRCDWGSATGAAGKAVFSKIDTSDPYLVTFVLANGTVLHLPTKKAFDEIDDMCKSINDDMEKYTKLVKEVDASTFVTDVAAFDENGDTGYRLTLGDGQVLTIRNGRSSRDSVLVGARTYTDGKLYWAYRTSSTADYQWITYNGSLISVELEDVTPRIGFVFDEGKFYFTVSYNGGDPQLMKDADGNPVEATGRIVSDFFTGVDLSDPLCVVLKMSDGTEIRLPRKKDHVPALTLHTRSGGIKADTTYTFQLLVELNDTLSVKKAVDSFEPYSEASGVKLDAIAVDGGYVHPMNVVTASVKEVDGQYAYNFVIDFPITTPPAAKWVVGHVSRYAIFVSWGNNSYMQVAEFTCI